jgi:hypothetical protein
LAGNLESTGSVLLGSYDSSGSLTVGGAFTSRAGAVTSLDAGSRLTASAVLVEAGSSLSGGGNASIVSDVTNAGEIGVAGRPFTIAGTFTQLSTGTLVAGDGYEVAISGHATLAGALDTTTGVPPPVAGTRSVAVTFPARTGNFTSHSLGFRLVTSATEVDVVAQPQLALSPTNVAAGGTVAVSGAGFPYDSTAAVYLDHVGGISLAKTAVNFHGFLQTSLVLPAGIVAGSHTIIATDGALSARATLKVT